MSRPRPKFDLVGSITGQPGELLAVVWHLGLLKASVKVSDHDLRRARGYGVEIFHDPAGGEWMLTAVNHPWVEPEPTDPREDPRGQVEHDLDLRHTRNR